MTHTKTEIYRLAAALEVNSLLLAMQARIDVLEEKYKLTQQASSEKHVDIAELARKSIDAFQAVPPAKQDSFQAVPPAKQDSFQAVPPAKQDAPAMTREQAENIYRLSPPDIDAITKVAYDKGKHDGQIESITFAARRVAACNHHSGWLNTVNYREDPMDQKLVDRVLTNAKEAFTWWATHPCKLAEVIKDRQKHAERQANADISACASATMELDAEDAVNLRKGLILTRPTSDFDAVWECIKTWRINCTGATGNHVRDILAALKNARDRERDWALLFIDLRAAGWTVAAHNDHNLHGVPYTIWIFTKDGRSVKGEGVTDNEALLQVAPTIANQK